MEGGTRSEPRDPGAKQRVRGAAQSRQLLPFPLCIAVEAGGALLSREKPDRFTVGLVLSVLSPVTMPALAY
jgi:hypothetical protein